MTWKELVRLKEWMPISEMPYKYYQYDRNIYKFEDTKYFLATDLNPNAPEEYPGGPYLAALVWACSDVAVKQAMRQNIEKDEKIIFDPPNELLPKNNAKTYSEICKEMKEIGISFSEIAGYSWSNGKFVHRLIQSKMAHYYFRERIKVEDKMPYAILWSLKVDRI
jgi:hypothetical protein